MTNELGIEIAPKKSRRWPPELRARQAEITRRAKNWQQSTGPKTQSGKDSSKMNAAKHGLRSETYRTVCALLREQQSILNATIAAALLELERQNPSCHPEAKPEGSPLGEPP